MIPIFIIIVSVPMDWGTISFGDTTLAVTQLVGAIIFAVASFTDWLDGKIARAQGLVTNFGKFAHPLADKMLVMTAFIVLVGQGKVPAWIVAIIVCRELAVTGLRLLLVEHGEVMAAAWPGKVKTATQMVAIIWMIKRIVTCIQILCGNLRNTCHCTGNINVQWMFRIKIA